MGKIRSIGMAEARPKLTQLVNDVSGGGDPYFVVANSKIKAVLIGIDQYNDMVERLEDLSDAAELLEAKLANEPMMPFEEHLKRSKAKAQSAGSDTTRSRRSGRSDRLLPTIPSPASGSEVRQGGMQG